MTKMDLSMFSKENKQILKKKAIINNDNVSINKSDKPNKLGVGRPEIKDSKEKLIHKFTINLNSYEKEFLDNLVDETGASISKYLRKKLIEAAAFK